MAGFLACSGFALDVPGVDEFEKHYSYQRDVLVLPKTSDSIQSEEELSYNRRAEEFARRYNQRLIRQGKRPNQALQPNAGTAPFADQALLSRG
jgi:hypothetical protein